MNHLRTTFFIVMALLVVLAACAPQSTPAVVVVTATTVPTDTPTPVSAAPATEAPPVATAPLAPISLLPPMQIGSTFAYVDGSILVAVPGGPFTRGRKGGTDNPEEVVTLGDFWIYRTKVTNQQYKLCVATGNCTTPNLQDNQGYDDFKRLNDPVSGVTWQQGSAYCTWVHGQLPTEAQWEKTARGDDSRLYPWGNNAPVCDLLNFNNCIGATTNVVKYPQGKSPYEALDMAGNAFEWVNDWYDPQYYRTGPTQEPPGPDTGQRKSVRSSSYKSNKDQAPVAVRSFDFPDRHRRDLGFRCVVQDPTYFAPMCQQTSMVGTGPSGAPSGAGVTYDCPNVSVSFAELSCHDQSTNVTFHDDHGIPESGGAPPPPAMSLTGTCSGPTILDANTWVYNCTTVGSASIDSTCTPVGGPAPATCAPHYNLNSGTGMCEWDGTGTTGGACPSGYELDPTRNCCSAVPGSGVDYPACGVGTSLVEAPPGVFNCVPSAVAPPPPHDDTSFTVPDPCGPPPGYNPYGGSLDSSPLYSALTKTDQAQQPPLAPLSGFLTLGVLGLAIWINYHGRKRS